MLFYEFSSQASGILHTEFSEVFKMEATAANLGHSKPQSGTARSG